MTDVPKPQLPIPDFYQQFHNLDHHHDSFETERPEWHQLPKHLLKQQAPIDFKAMAKQLSELKKVPLPKI